MDSFLIAYIGSRMKEMGYTCFHFEPVFFTDEGNTSQIKAHNEFYYLVAKTLPASLLIASETNIFTEANVYGDFNLYGIQEFSGLIEISQPVQGIALEFIRVVPQTTNR